MLDLGKLERMAKQHKHTKPPLAAAIGRADDSLSRELREAARLLIDLYLWRHTAARKRVSKVDDSSRPSTM
jgi:hypothetical protein